MNRDDHLWNPPGAPDPEVAELERLLGRFAHDGRPLARRNARRPARLAAAALVLALGAAVWALTRPDGGLELRAGDVRLAEGAWFTATATDHHLSLGTIGELRLAPGSRLQVRRVAQDQTHLYLEGGWVHARIAPEVRPRFFQFETPSALCVDLGCEYDLRVADDGSAHVVVARGRVALERGGRDVYVPRGAECRAHPERGLGTPRFSAGDPTLASVLDRFDREADLGRRADFAEKLVAVVEQPRDTLVLWHLLRDADPRIAKIAERRLIEIAGRPPRFDSAARAVAWRAHLEPLWQ